SGVASKRKSRNGRRLCGRSASRLTRACIHKFAMGALAPKADIVQRRDNFRFVPKADISRSRRAKPTGCVLATANGMTAEQEVPGRNPPSTQLPARSWLIPDSRGAHSRFGILAHTESILPPLPDNHRELTLCSPPNHQPAAC